MTKVEEEPGIELVYDIFDSNEVLATKELGVVWHWHRCSIRDVLATSDGSQRILRIGYDLAVKCRTAADPLSNVMKRFGDCFAHGMVCVDDLADPGAVGCDARDQSVVDVCDWIGAAVRDHQRGG